MNDERSQPEMKMKNVSKIIKKLTLDHETAV